MRSMPLALRCGSWDEPGVVCAHSLPGPAVMERFDADVLRRDLTEDDYEPRQGSAHLMVWGRQHTPEMLRHLSETWNVSLFVLGHQKAETGAMFAASQRDRLELGPRARRGSADGSDGSSRGAGGDLERGAVANGDSLKKSNLFESKCVCVRVDHAQNTRCVTARGMPTHKDL